MSTIIKTIEADNHRILIVGDGIIRVYSRGDVTHTCIEKVFSELSKIDTEEKFLMLIDTSEEKSMTSDAKSTIKNLGEKYCKGMAVITIKEHVKRIANILIKIDNPRFHVKMFTSKVEAENWLMSL